MKFISFIAASVLSVTASAAVYRVDSPAGELSCFVNTGDSLSFSLKQADGKVLVGNSSIGLSWTDGSMWGVKDGSPRQRRYSKNSIIPSPFYKKSEVKENFNGLDLIFKNFTLQVKVFDDGMAYRFVNHKGKEGEVSSEKALYRLPGDVDLWAPRVRNRKKKTDGSHEKLFWNDMQNHYTHAHLSEFKDGSLFFTPLLAGEGNLKIAFAEADVEDYPGMYLAARPVAHTLEGVLAQVPDSVKIGGHNDLERLVKTRRNFIARVEGVRFFPWRAFIISRSDTELPDNDMVYRLASPCRISDISWIKPGKVAWEWWNDWGLYGVDFKAGVNNDTYKAYIDFASRNGIEYVILDEGWAVKGKADLLDVVPEIDLQMLADYAKSKNVDLILWAGYLAFDLDMERVVKYYADMGIKGFKIDFLNRDDQDMIRFMYRAADVCARNKMLVDFHGCSKPTGLQRTYPNVINYEAVFGLEQMKWSKPDTDQITYDVTLPFIRSIAGPMDYTSGAMRNAVPGQYTPNRHKPMSQGTRCRQLAQFVVFDAPLSMLCDSPSDYDREPECMEFLSDVPTTFNITKVLKGKVGEYVAIARCADDGTWYVGAMTDLNSRNLSLPLDFLKDGMQYEAAIWRDGSNSDKNGCDYRMSKSLVTSRDSLAADMAAGGGFVAIIRRK